MMQRKMMFFFGICFFLFSAMIAPRTNAQDGDPDYRSVKSWSSPIYRPGIGDIITAVNDREVSTEREFFKAVKNAPKVIVLTVYDPRNENYYYLKTTLNPKNARSRLGLYVEDSYKYDGVRAIGYWEGYPCTRCRLNLD